MRDQNYTPTRREFLQLLAAVVPLGPEVLAMQRPGPAGIPLRPLGKSGAMISMVGLGGWDSVANKTDEEAIALMHEALDLGIAFWDNAWEYHNGRAEDVMGRALQGGKREKVFLMTKVCARDYEGFKKHFDDSLRRLRTDRVDLLQFHSIQYAGDRERIFDPENGGLKAALEAKKAGKIRYLGFTGHMDPKEHLHMLAAPYEWDSVQMPLNVLDAHYLSFQQQVLPECRKRNIGVLGMKSLGAQQGRIPRDLKMDWEICRRYAMSLPVSAVVCGLQTREELRGLARLARDFKPLTNEDIEKVLVQSKGIAQDGSIEQYKNRRSYFGCSYHSAVLRSAATSKE